ncbi:MAG: DUF924 domain-containing protein [Sterolibacteriaceae bacterium]|nr:DUF924 domain-containing protein [Sterolibacteriaceae bacterium]MBK9084426.1 DUF924 domain-containing protein [Sterolibacteriaceae bacterium]
MTGPIAQQVLGFWFGAPDSPEHGRSRDVWFRKDAAFDRQIAGRFGGLIEAALAGDLAHWPRDASSALAQIVVLDQFTRNVFRDQPRAFVGDARALAAARAMLAAGQHAALSPVERAFVYLPFEHAEDFAAQDESVRLFAELASAAPELESMLDYARRHHAVIARFGRFPHRNALLGRASSAAELAFLQEPGSRF